MSFPPKKPPKLKPIVLLHRSRRNTLAQRVDFCGMAAAKCNLMIQIFSNLKKVRELETARMDLEKARNASQIGLFKARTIERLYVNAF